MCKFSFIFLTLGLAFASVTAKAQMADRLSERPLLIKHHSDEAIAVTREMTNRLHLNEGQFLQLLPLNRTRLAGMHDIDAQYRNDANTRSAKAAELEAQFEQECSRILTPSQLSQLQQESTPPATAPATGGNGLG